MLEVPDVYAYTNDSVKSVSKKVKPKLAIFLGDEEESSFKGTDNFDRIEVKNAKIMFKMLKGKRVHYINCLLPFCQYIARKFKLKLNFLKTERKANPVRLFFRSTFLSQLERNRIEKAAKTLYLNQTYQNIFKQMCNEYEFTCKNFLLNAPPRFEVPQN